MTAKAIFEEENLHLFTDMMNSNRIFRKNITSDKLKNYIKNMDSPVLQKYIFEKAMAGGGQIDPLSLIVLGPFSIWVFFHLIFMIKGQ